MVSLQFRQCDKIQLINYFFLQLYQISNTRNGVENKNRIQNPRDDLM